MNRKNKRDDIKSRIIDRQTSEIESLKKKIDSLKLSCEEKNELISSIDTLRINFIQEIDNIKNNSKKLDKLISELNQMKVVMNRTFFKGRWRIIKWLLK